MLELSTLHRALLLRAIVHALPLDAPAGRRRVAARRPALHDAAKGLLNRRDALVPPVRSGSLVIVQSVRLVLVVAVTTRSLVRGDEEHAPNTPAERGDLGPARAHPQCGERPDDVRDQVRAVLAAKRRAHQDPPVTADSRMDGQFIGLRRQQLRWPGVLVVLRDSGRRHHHRRGLSLQLLHVIEHLGQQRRLVRLHEIFSSGSKARIMINVAY
jgi:hypothetical protein